VKGYIFSLYMIQGNKITIAIIIGNDIVQQNDIN